MKVKLIHGDCLKTLDNFAVDSIDAVVTDPPYLLNFMNLPFDSQHKELPGDNEGQKMQSWHRMWLEKVYRVLKPGAHILVFGGTRTFHRLASAVEDIGFEIRDTIMWVYGSGFPKSHNISKAIDKVKGEKGQIIGDKLDTPGYHLSPGGGGKYGGGGGLYGHREDARFRAAQITAPASDKAKQWDGWGTALKPAHEPILLARKPLEKGFSVAWNVLKWGTGGINIDASRIESIEMVPGGGSGRTGNFAGKSQSNAPLSEHRQKPHNKGRWPANIILGCTCEGKEGSGKHVDGNCPCTTLDKQSGVSRSSGGTGEASQKAAPNPYIYGKYKEGYKPQSLGGFGDIGGASRFYKQIPLYSEQQQKVYYCAKASKKERNRGLNGATNNHATVKPLKLVKYLVQLITPPGGIVLDPFMGSGTTGMACAELGFTFFGIEKDEGYFRIAKERIGASCSTRM